MVKIINHSNLAKIVEPGERIAQLVLMPYLAPHYTQVMTLTETDRGTGGFGSTGTH